MTQYPPYQQPNQPMEPNYGYSNLPPQDQESLGGWVLVTFIMFIPLVNIIYLLVLAFGSTNSMAKRNFARASLIWMLVGIVLSIVMFILFAAMGASLFNEISNTYGLLAL
ncbi:hypothetical protein [Enteractinococcus helveticum]|nr:hypothetical protein [Enteractinococcus helveticum]